MSTDPHDDTIGGAPRQVVHSADAVALELPVAGPTSRILAYAIDASILYGFLVLLLLLLVLLAPAAGWVGEAFQRLGEQLGGADADEDPAAVLWLPLVVVFLVATFAELIYFTCWELAGGGRSPGKRALGLQVLRDGGLPLTASASLARNLLRLADALPSTYLTGLVAMLVTRDGKRLGDLVAGTVVVRHDRVVPAPPLALDEDPEEARFQLSRDQVARLGREGRMLVRKTLRRVEKLGPGQREAALERSVGALQARIGYAEEVAPADRLAFLRALWRATARR